MPAPSELKRAVLRLAYGIVIVDALFMAAYLLTRFASRPTRQHWIFVGVWTAVTLVVVLRGLAEVRKARVGLRRARMTQP